MHNFTIAEKELLLKIAKDAIYYGLQHKKEMHLVLNNLPDKLKQNAATFVTLNIHGNLRGCIGSLIAHQALATDVAHNAFNAAFLDPRFASLNSEEFSQIQIVISVLSNPKKIQFDNEKDLLNKITPQVDGLILTDGAHKGTFLPSVWEIISNKKTFLQQLKLKAGLPINYWSKTITIEKYQAEKICNKAATLY